MFYGHGHRHCGCHGRDQGHGHGCDQGHGCSCSHGHGYYHPAPPPIHLDALEILRRRYASGEIDDTTFQHMRERLGASTGPERPPEG
ncbi:MAG TPA: SHOCT domain-containing protein [Ktedonobacteraceae bacterium]|nr:SHOCT domain-containing protein [Ktedonobacteraceae bacterium]